MITPGGVRARKRTQLSCERCRRIKRQCDRNAPCGRCVQNVQECSLKSRRKTPATSRLDSPQSITLASNVDIARNVDLRREELSVFPVYATPSSENESLQRSHHPQDRRVNANDIWSLIETTNFIKPIIELYTEEIDWIWEFIKDSRLEHLMRLDSVTQNRPVWNGVKVFALAIVAVTAQLCPVDVEAILLCLNTDSPNFATSSFDSATSIMEAAYSEAIAFIKMLAYSEPSASGLTLQQSIWTPEVFAATYILRNFEKNEGAYRKQSEGLAVDMLRLQHAGYARQPCLLCDAGKQFRIEGPGVVNSHWALDHTPLTHNVFWAYFTLDRLSNVVAGSTYLLQAKYANICLHDVFGHTHITKLVEFTTRQTGPPVQSTNNSTIDQPVQNAYAGAKCRLAAIVAHFIDRLTGAHQPAFNWPKDAEAIVRDLEGDLSSFESTILPVLDNPSDRFCKAKKLTLVLCMELLRANVTAQIHALFAATLYQPSLSAEPINAATRESIGWQMERRKLESAKILIARVLPYSQAALRLHSWWPFFATSVHQQVNQILVVLQKKSESGLFARYTAVEDQRGASSLLDYVRYAIKGRNFLVLLARNNNLTLVQSHTENVCLKLDSFFASLGIDYDKEAFSDKKRVVDEYAPIRAMKSKLDILSNSTIAEISGIADNIPVLSDSSITFNDLPTSEFAWDAIMNDMLELERLFPIPNAIDGVLAL